VIKEVLDFRAKTELQVNQVQLAHWEDQAWEVDQEKLVLQEMLDSLDSSVFQDLMDRQELTEFLEDRDYLGY